MTKKDIELDLSDREFEYLSYWIFSFFNYESREEEDIEFNSIYLKLKKIHLIREKLIICHPKNKWKIVLSEEEADKIAYFLYDEINIQCQDFIQAFKSTKSILKKMLKPFTQYDIKYWENKLIQYYENINNEGN